MAEPLPAHIGPFEVRRRIGRGGMATVYAAYDPQMHREVAIKVLSPAMTPDATLRERFLREVRVNLRLQHPAILPIHSLGDEGESVYIVMALASGGSLDARLRSAPPLRSDEITRIVSLVAAGLDHAHGRGVVHRDLKPANVLFDNGGAPLIADFGIARFQGDATTRLTQGVTIGTPLYLSPEQARGEAVTGSTDIYALAIMTYELLTGTPPFTGDTPVQVMYAHLTDPLPDRGLPSSVQQVLERGAAKRPEDRYTSASEFAHALASAEFGLALDSALRGGVPPIVVRSENALARPAGVPHSEPARAAPRTVPLIIIGVLGVLAIVVLAALLSPDTASTDWLPYALGAIGAAIAIGSAVVVSRRGRTSPAAESGWVEPRAPEVTDRHAALSTTQWPAAQASAPPPPLPPQSTAPSGVSARRQILEPGQKLAEYRIVERLDDGDRTRVYHAFDERRQRDVAVRVISMDTEAPERAQRLEREAALLGRLHHAHIVPFFDFGSTGGASYIVMPLLGGHSLQTHIRRSGGLPLDLTLELTRQIAGALHYLHGEGIISRDLKPSGLVFDRHQNLYLADLRIAKDTAEAEDVRLTMAGQPLGTPMYMSPEQFLGDRITPAADQYVLACVIFEMLTGKRPFEADSPFALMLKHVREDPPAAAALRPDVPDAVDSALAIALAKDPARRFPDVMAFLESMEEACALRVASTPVQPTHGHVFISYSRDDGEFAHRLADELRRRGLEVWIDARLEPSDQWWRVIVDAIDRCAAFVSIMSPAAYGSKWVEREVLLADQRGKPPFPLLLRGQAFPIYVGTQYVDVSDADLPPPAFFDRIAQVARRPTV